MYKNINIYISLRTNKNTDVSKIISDSYTNMMQGASGKFGYRMFIDKRENPFLYKLFFEGKIKEAEPQQIKTWISTLKSNKNFKVDFCESYIKDKKEIEHDEYSK